MKRRRKTKERKKRKKRKKSAKRTAKCNKHNYAIPSPKEKAPLLNSRKRVKYAIESCLGFQ